MSGEIYGIEKKGIKFASCCFFSSSGFCWRSSFEKRVVAKWKIKEFKKFPFQPLFRVLAFFVRLWHKRRSHIYIWKPEIVFVSEIFPPFDDSSALLSSSFAYDICSSCEVSSFGLIRDLPLNQRMCVSHTKQPSRARQSWQELEWEIFSFFFCVIFVVPIPQFFLYFYTLLSTRHVICSALFCRGFIMLAYFVDDRNSRNYSFFSPSRFFSLRAEWRGSRWKSEFRIEQKKNRTEKG